MQTMLTFETGPWERRNNTQNTALSNYPLSQALQMSLLPLSLSLTPRKVFPTANACPRTVRDSRRPLGFSFSSPGVCSVFSSIYQT